MGIMIALLAKAHTVEPVVGAYRVNRRLTLAVEELMNNSSVFVSVTYFSL